VAGDIKRIWDRRRGYVEPPPPPLSVTGPSSTEDPGDESVEPIPVEIARRPVPTRPGLSITDLPRRLFRNLSSTTPIPPLLIYLFDKYQPSPNSHNGYPLSRAVLAKNVEVIKYLLDKGADPGMRDGLAIEISVKLGDLGIVKMLVEHQSLNPVSIDGGPGPTPDGSGTGFRFGTEIPSRWVETAVKSGSDEIVSYFVHEKGQYRHPHFLQGQCTDSLGVMPPLHSIMQLGKNDRKRKLLDMSREEGKKRSKSSITSTSNSHVAPRSDSNHDMKRITKKKPKSGMKGKTKS
jgi:hypothetical protein